VVSVAALQQSVAAQQQEISQLKNNRDTTRQRPNSSNNIIDIDSNIEENTNNTQSDNNNNPNNNSDNINYNITTAEIESINNRYKKAIITIGEEYTENYNEWDPQAATTEKTRLQWVKFWEQGWKQIQCNPRIPVLPKPIWQAIAQSKFIELEEFKKDVLRDKGVFQTQAIISADGTILLEQQRPNKHITNTLQWLEAFNNYSTAVTTIYHLRSEELAAYQKDIVTKATIYGFKATYEYDRAVHRQIERDRMQTLATVQPQLEAQFLHSGRL